MSPHDALKAERDEAVALLTPFAGFFSVILGKKRLPDDERLWSTWDDDGNEICIDAGLVRRARKFFRKRAHEASRTAGSGRDA